jgi:hypothetical protein
MIMRHKVRLLRLDSLNIVDISTKFNIYRIVAVEWCLFFAIVTIVILLNLASNGF